jgi:predicted esterase
MAEVVQVPTIVHGRVLFEAPAEPTALLVGFHGYAQLAEDALAFLRPLAAGRPWALAAPQALHPFYRPRDQAVVAGWMTRLDRELAVEDNVAYTARAIGELRQRLPGARGLAIVGFSQGVAMAYRTAARCGQRVDAVVALAGDVPPELHAVDGNGAWGSRPAVLIGRGSGEEWYGEEKLAADVAALGELGLEAEVCRFDGGHEWAPPFVERAKAFLAARLD